MFWRPFKCEDDETAGRANLKCGYRCRGEHTRHSPQIAPDVHPFQQDCVGAAAAAMRLFTKCGRRTFPQVLSGLLVQMRAHSLVCSLQCRPAEILIEAFYDVLG